MAANAQRALDAGFRAFKLEGRLTGRHRRYSPAQLLRHIVGDDARVMVDANQQWSVPKAIAICRMSTAISPYLDRRAYSSRRHPRHRQIAAEIAPLSIALGEHVPNRVIFKNYLETGCIRFLQPDCVRIGGVSEFLTVSLMAKKFGVPVVPHVGDMGQIHQHLVLFNHVALDLPKLFLETFHTCAATSSILRK